MAAEWGRASLFLSLPDIIIDHSRRPLSMAMEGESSRSQTFKGVFLIVAASFT
jgi:hypothetical protein